ncbi:hypothetical protein ACAW74_15830 [Fibrella sp. WM1]|uniref:hypothetical protein n=1 Tax=Fibrella musci TaxID=3242485 RepID=UPI003521FFBA
MPKKPAPPPLPSRPQLLLATLCLLVGVFSALKATVDYVATGTLSWYLVVLALLGLALGGRTLRRLKDNA